MHIYISLGSEYTNLPQIIIPCKERAIFWNPYFPFLSVHCIYFCIFLLVLTFNSNVGNLEEHSLAGLLSQSVVEANKVPQAAQLTTKLFDTTICKSL